MYVCMYVCVCMCVERERDRDRERIIEIKIKIWLYTHNQLKDWKCDKTGWNEIAPNMGPLPHYTELQDINRPVSFLRYHKWSHWIIKQIIKLYICKRVYVCVFVCVYVRLPMNKYTPKYFNKKLLHTKNAKLLIF